MKLAYFSPMPPARTGIATYSRALVGALRHRCDVTVFTQTQDADPVEGVEVIDFSRNPYALKALGSFDNALYHIGNNPWYHLEILKALSVFPGAVCLHDTVVYYLAAGLGKGGLLKELLLADPVHAFRDLRRIEDESTDADLLRFASASRHPCIQGLLQLTPHIVVHNETSAGVIRSFGYSGRIDVIPLLQYEGGFAVPTVETSLRARAALGYSKEEVVFGAFGFIGPTKRLERVLDALAILKGRGETARIRLLIVGEGAGALGDKIRELGLETIVRCPGFISDDQFRTHLSAIDALVNLRYPSHGESSATLIQAMSFGIPCLVTDDASFSELPDGTVVKIGCATTEVEEIAGALSRMARDPAWARQIGEAGRAHIAAYHAPDLVAARFVEALRDGGAVRRAGWMGQTARSFSPIAFLQARAAQLIP
jgi:glycosyltransferase involved in cell wall biosynthesis